ncbi:MAG: hypothetical protein ABFS38_04015 [Bacteroidota bacterium]
MSGCKTYVDTGTPEATYEQACTWWPELNQKWTPIGWPEHQQRFNAFWNGSLMAHPAPWPSNPELAWQGVLFSPTNKVYNSYAYLNMEMKRDIGNFRQGWNKGDVPELWTQWWNSGIQFRSEVFAYASGFKELEHGDEPLLAWMRISIDKLIQELPQKDSITISGVIYSPDRITAKMFREHNVFFDNRDLAYTRSLHAVSGSDSNGFLVVEDNGKVRLGLRGEDFASFAFIPKSKSEAGKPVPRGESMYDIVEITMKVEKGNYVDVLIPMLPTDKAVFEQELRRGRTAAKASCEAFYQNEPEIPAIFSVSEPAINDCMKQSVRFSKILTEANAINGEKCKITGSWKYAGRLWATPVAMDLVMMMDVLGHHDYVESCLSVFKNEQGTVVPPGPTYVKHPGYLSTPAAYKSVDWLSDNGAILYMLSMHGLLSGNEDYMNEYTDVIVRSCEWIRDVRAQTNHDGYKKVLPPGVATDLKTSIQAVWNDGWNYKGLTTAVKMLKEIDHPRAVEFEEEAKRYREDFREAFQTKLKTMPRWEDAAGKEHYLVPTSLYGDSPLEYLHAFYLDTGPLFLVFSGLMSADDPAMRSSLDWFREGPPHQQNNIRIAGSDNAECDEVALLDHEISSCEPMYSWNMFHNLELADRKHFMEGMYSLFAGAISQQTLTSCETRAGITGTVFSASLAIYLARLAVIDDETRDNELHLLHLVPQVWLQKDKELIMEYMPTIYGPVTLRGRLSDDGASLNLEYTADFRIEPARVVLHRPPLEGLKRVYLNGEKMHFDDNQCEL